MPLYEYVCEQDGSVIELLRPIDRADAPVEDPQGRGRTFARRLSTFAAASGTSAGGGLSGGGGGGGCCPCGKNAGSCSRR
ncbi:MAG: zinc ribbon domain-containing protein [Phycisphaeraceae bacterium]|nr:MAG: zinc ribbon domain-containing protein [Phycisphaeraceae bacterium]